MASNKRKLKLLAAFFFAGAVQTAEAQSLLSGRASGMAGAFVGVADDASAVYWNPAGLATGAYASLVVDFGVAESLPADPGSAARAERYTGRLAGISLPPVGLAYYRQGAFATGPRGAAVTGVPGREEVRRSVHALVLSTTGLALLQSLGEYVVVGTTLKLVRGSAARGTTTAADAAGGLDAAEALSGQSHTTGDLDAGVMVDVQRVRVGLVARNLTTPAFDLEPAGSGPLELEREVRAGAAWGSGWPGHSRVIVAVDADLKSRSTPGGDRRDVAAGVETWWRARRFGVRAGARRSMIGDSRPLVAAGLSAGLTASMFVDAHVARGRQDERSWSVGARVGF